MWRGAPGARIELAALLPVVSLVSDLAGQRASAHGIGDATLAATWRLTRGPGARHARGLGTGLVDYGLNVVSQHQVHSRATVRLNGGELTMAWSQKASLLGSAIGWQIGTNISVRQGVTVDAGAPGGGATPRAVSLPKRQDFARRRGRVCPTPADSRHNFRPVLARLWKS